ncbi:RagB/SusD family nutrient uptake outer membrane protein [Flavitalea flava]
MSTKYLIPLAILGSLIFTGCQKLTEDPKATITAGTYYNTAADLQAGLSGVYEQYAYDGTFGFTNRMTTYFGSDDLTTDPGLNKGPLREFDRLSGTSQNTAMDVYNAWKGIYQVNNLLFVYQKADAPDSIKKVVAGQCYFLRAMGYYYLVRTYGPLPLVTTPVNPNSHPPRAEVAKIYDTIVSDLKMAKRLLPNQWPAKEIGRATAWAAKSMLADVYLTMTGWPLNQTANYALAAAEAGDVIQNGPFNLSTPYDQVFTKNNTPETVFALQFSVANNLPQRGYGNSCVPLEETALNGNSGWDDFYPEINFYKNAPVCSRTDATFYTTIKLLNSDKTTYTLVNWDDSRTRARHPYYKKFRAGLNSDGVSETANTINYMNPSTNKALDIIRYPLVLLDFAEASTMAAGNPSSEAYTAINQVRQRAGEGPLTPGLSGTAFRDAVVYERGYEFAGEFGIRWFDIVRLQLLPQVIAARDAGENPIPTSITSDPAVLQQKYLAPIPFRDMNLEPGWIQNAGY